MTLHDEERLFIWLEKDIVQWPLEEQLRLDANKDIKMIYDFRILDEKETK